MVNSVDSTNETGYILDSYEHISIKKNYSEKQVVI